VDDNRIWDSLKPRWRDAAYAGMGAIAAIRLPKYLEGVVDRYQRRQAEMIAEELRKQELPYKAEGQDGS